MRSVYIATYDIADDKRLRKVFKLMRGYGDHLQYSVFRCELSERERIELVGKLSEVINHQSDQVLLFSLGPVGGLRDDTIYSLGILYQPPEHVAVII